MKDLKTKDLDFDLNGAFSNSYSAVINSEKLFYVEYDTFPNIIEIGNVDFEKIITNLQKMTTINFERLKKIGRKYYNTQKRKYLFQQYVILFDMPLIINLEDDDSAFLLYADTLDEAQTVLFKSLEKLLLDSRIDKSNKHYIHIIKREDFLDLHPVEIKRPALNIKTHYNDDFEIVHETILKRLNKNNDKGLVLLYGLPGTGKTHYLRYLASRLRKKMVFVTPDLASQISQPAFMTLLLRNPNSILIIEDAENIIVDRTKTGSSEVSTLLNLSDGLLSDCLNIQIICTFNTKISTVDNALLRKGRLIAKYEFKELAKEKAQLLSDKLGFKEEIKADTRLSDLYNQNEKLNNDQKIEKQPIGFVSNNKN